MSAVVTPVVVLASLALILSILVDAFEVMLLPRRAQRRVRFVRMYFNGTWALWARVGRRLARLARREGFLSWYGPLSMVVLLVIWASGLMLAFAGLQWATHHGTADAPAFSTQLYASGVTFLTLGYGDVTPTTAPGRVLAVVEAGTGYFIIAIIIGYLPVLYQLFSKREAHVIRLDARAGSPPTATTLLARHAEGERLDALDAFFQEWEQWAAELLESHLAYPMLAYYRSQHDNQSWLAALAAVMDSCALVLTGFRDVNTFQARMTFSTTRFALVEMTRVFGAYSVGAVGAGVGRERLPADEFRRLAATLEEAGLEFSDGAGAYGELAAFRETYEPFVVALAEHLVLPVPRWVAPEDALDNWQRSKGAFIVKDLVESVEARPG